MKIRLDKKALMPLILFASLFINEDVLVFGTINNASLVNFRLAVQVCLAVFLLGYMMLNKVGIKKSRFRIFGIFAICYLATMLINRDFRLGYVFMLLIYFICLAMTTLYSFDDIYKFFCKMMFVICIVSLVGYLIQMLFPNVLNMFPVITNTVNNKFYFLGLTNVNFRTDAFIRNWGAFREPGVYQLFIIVALIYTLFRDRESNWAKPLVFIVTILTTFSTTGYIALGLIILAAILVDKKRLTKSQKRLLSVIVIATIALVLYLSFFTDLLFKSSGYGSVFGKLLGAYESVSFNARMASIWGNLQMFFENPIFGKGITFVDDNYAIIASNMYGMRVVDNTNMIFILLARFGIFIFVYFFYRLYKSIRDSYKLSHLSTSLIFATYLVLMTGENLSYSVIMVLPIFILSCDVNNNSNI